MTAVQKCEPCGKTFTNKFELKEHCWTFLHHIKLEQKAKKQTHLCDLCSSVSATLADYSTHLESDTHRENANIWDQMSRAAQDQTKKGQHRREWRSPRETNSSGWRQNSNTSQKKRQSGVSGQYSQQIGKGWSRERGKIAGKNSGGKNFSKRAKSPPPIPKGATFPKRNSPRNGNNYGNQYSAPSYVGRPNWGLPTSWVAKEQPLGNPIWRYPPPSNEHSGNLGNSATGPANLSFPPPYSRRSVPLLGVSPEQTGLGTGFNAGLLPPPRFQSLDSYQPDLTRPPPVIPPLMSNEKGRKEPMREEERGGVTGNQPMNGEIDRTNQQDVKRLSFLGRPQSAPNHQLLYVESSDEECAGPPSKENSSSAPMGSSSNNEALGSSGLGGSVSKKSAKYDRPPRHIRSLLPKDKWNLYQRLMDKIKQGTATQAILDEKMTLWTSGRWVPSAEKWEKKRKSVDSDGARKRRSTSVEVELGDLSICSSTVSTKGTKKKRKGKSTDPAKRAVYMANPMESEKKNSKPSLIWLTSEPNVQEMQSSVRESSMANSRKEWKRKESQVVQEEADSTTTNLPPATPVVTGAKRMSPRRDGTVGSLAMDKQAKWDKVYRRTLATSAQSKSQKMFKDRQNKYRITAPNLANAPAISSVSVATAAPSSGQNTVELECTAVSSSANERPAREISEALIDRNSEEGRTSDHVTEPWTNERRGLAVIGGEISDGDLIGGNQSQPASESRELELRLAETTSPRVGGTPRSSDSDAPSKSKKAKKQFRGEAQRTASESSVPIPIAPSSGPLPAEESSAAENNPVLGLSSNDISSIRESSNNLPDIDLNECSSAIRALYEVKSEASEALKQNSYAGEPPRKEITPTENAGVVKEEVTEEGEVSANDKDQRASLTETRPTEGGGQEDWNPDYARQNVYVAGFSFGNDREGLDRPVSEEFEAPTESEALSFVNRAEENNTVGNNDDVIRSAIRVKMEMMEQEDDVICLDEIAEGGRSDNTEQSKSLQKLWDLCQEEERMIQILRDYDAHIKLNGDRIVQLERESGRLAEMRNRECVTLKEIRAKRRQLLAETSGEPMVVDGNEMDFSASNQAQIDLRPSTSAQVHPVPSGIPSNFPSQLNPLQNPAFLNASDGSPVRIAYLGVLPSARSLTEGLQQMVDKSVGHNSKQGKKNQRTKTKGRKDQPILRKRTHRKKEREKNNSN